MKMISRLKLNPVPRGANYRTVNTFRMMPRYMYAYQLLYIFEGRGGGRLDDSEFFLEPGVLSMYGPGTLHEFYGGPGESMTITTMCFSWYDVNDKQLSKSYQSTEKITDDYYEYADEPVQIEGFPPFPFHIAMKEPQRSRVEEILREIGSAWRHSFSPLLQLRAKSVLAELVYLIEKQIEHENEPPEPPSLGRFRDFVEKNFAFDIDRKDAAAAAGVSESHLTALLIRHLNTNFSEYLTRTRLRNAADMLQYSMLSIKEIAEKTGFNTTSYFIFCFRRQYGMSPGQARNGH